MERREFTALARVLTVAMRESIAAEVRDLKEQIQEVKVYVDQRVKEISVIKGEPGRDAEPVDYHIIGAQIQAEVDKRLEASLRAALAEIPIINGIDGKDADPETVKAMVLAEIPIPKDGRDADPQVMSEMVMRAVAALPPPRDGKDADMETVYARIESEVTKRVAAIPIPKDGNPGRDAEPVDIDAIVLKVAELIPTPKDGERGKDAPPVDTSLIVAEVLRQIPTPKDGESVDMAVVEEMVSRAVDTIPRPKDGKDAEPINPELIVLQVLSRIPTPRDGKDGESVSLETVKEMVVAEATRAVQAIPPPRDGVDGKDAHPVDVEAVAVEVMKRIPVPKDGRSIEPQEVKAMVSEEVRQFVAAMPPPKDGKDGKDAEPIHPDTIALMIAKAAAALPPPRDGKDGNDGRSALSMDILPTIDPTKSYPRGTEAHYRGGTIKAVRTTDPVGDGPLEQAGWSIIANGFDSSHTRFVQSEDPRILELEVPFTSGDAARLKAYFPVPTFRGYWSKAKNENYMKSDMVQHDGSIWMCLNDYPRTYPGLPGSDWQLVVKRGADAKPAKDGERGPKGDKGDPGRDLTQMDSSGRKW